MQRSLPVMCAAYGLMLGHPLLGQRTYDVLRVIQLLAAAGHTEIHLAGKGWGALPAILAAVLSANAQQVTLKHALSSFHELAVHEDYQWPYAAMPFGVLEHFDLPDCHHALEVKKLSNLEPWGAGGAIRVEKGARGGTQGIIAGNKSTIPGAENISGAVKQTGPIFIGGHPKDASASFGASVRRGDFFLYHLLPESFTNGACLRERGLALHSSTTQQLTLMKHSFRLLVRLACAVLLFSSSTMVRADLPQQRKALDELQAAKKADDPLPLLESAKDRITKANKGNRGGDKKDVIAKIDEAIQELKAGNKNKMEQKINAAIANLHQGKDKSKRPK